MPLLPHGPLVAQLLTELTRISLQSDREEKLIHLIGGSHGKETFPEIYDQIEERAHALRHLTCVYYSSYLSLLKYIVENEKYIKKQLLSEYLLRYPLGTVTAETPLEELFVTLTDDGLALYFSYPAGSEPDVLPMDTGNEKAFNHATWFKETFEKMMKQSKKGS